MIIRKDTSDGRTYSIANTKMKINMQMKDTRRDVKINYFDRWKETSIERLIK